MSEELKPTGEFTVGQTVWASPRFGDRTVLRKARVVRIARVWAEAEVEGWSHQPIRFRTDSGLGDQAAQFHIEVPGLDAYKARVSAAWAVLEAHGFLVDQWQRREAHDAELFAVAELLEAGETS